MLVALGVQYKRHDSFMSNLTVAVTVETTIIDMGE